MLNAKDKLQDNLDDAITKAFDANLSYDDIIAELDMKIQCLEDEKVEQGE